MKIYNNPPKSDWEELCRRPNFEQASLEQVVNNIIEKVKTEGDVSLFELTEKFDKVRLNELQVSNDEIELASKNIPKQLVTAIQLAKENISKFHEAQKEESKQIETSPGVLCWRKSVAIESVGLYIPGGSAPLFSTILMLAIPAKLAGCKEIILCTPPQANGEIDATILFTAQLLGVNKIFKVGGAQAIAAMAFGTESIAKVNKIFGPGNQFVTKAKELIQATGIAIDMPAGPSEVLVIADQTAIPSFVAADLLAQAEHGPDSQVVLLSDKQDIISKVIKNLEAQIALLPRRSITKKAINNSFAILLKDLDTCLEFSNSYAPEHLIIASDIAAQFTQKISNAGSVFLGNYSCESAGDYASGTNHTLPTNAYAKSYSGVSLDSFYKKITFQQITQKGLQNIGPAIEIMAEAEGLMAHKNAVSIRLKNTNNV